MTFNQGLRITIMLMVIHGIILLLVITYKLDAYWGGSKLSWVNIICLPAEVRKYI